jgi:hypothetical protein
MAMLRYGSASVVTANTTANDWTDKVYKEACSGNKCRLKTAKNIIAKYSPDKFILTHCTIVASVDTELADPKDPKTDYLIHPAFSNLVNNNGDAWSKGVIKNSYKTFIGAENYLEHVQISHLSKGKIIDAVPREIVIGKDADGKDLTTYYIDILVATDRKNEDLCKKIVSGEMSSLSMGCLIKFSVCSKCGNKAVDETEACDHVKYQKNNTFFDDNGIQRKIAELCGSESDPDSVKFIEASWVRQPAFTGAVLRNIVLPDEEIMAKLEAAGKIAPYQTQKGDFLKAAAFKNLIAADDETPSPAEDKATPAKKDDDKPVDDAAADSPVSDTPTSDASPVDAPDTPAPEDTTPMTTDEFSAFKDILKKKVLRQISDEIKKEMEDNPDSGSSSVDETLIKPASASLNKIWKSHKALNKFMEQKLGSIKLSKKDYDRLQYGIHIALTNDDLTTLKDYGYNRRDVMAVLSFVDSCFKDPLSLDIKKSITKLGSLENKTAVEVLTKVVNDVSRKLTRKEAYKTLSWIRLLNFYK